MELISNICFYYLALELRNTGGSNWLSLKKTIIKYCFDSFGKLRKLVVTLSLISRSKMNFDKRGLRFTFYYQLD